MTTEEQDTMRQLVDALRHARPHVLMSPIVGQEEVVTEIDIALISADELIQWSDDD